MEDFVLELELLRQLEEENSDSEEVEAKEEIATAMDELAFLFRGLDEFLIAMDEESDA